MTLTVTQTVSHFSPVAAGSIKTLVFKDVDDFLRFERRYADAFIS